ncbi:MAG: hypothetical protein VYA34_10765 [Myxococcota bacterium]|nr:hypothetical protein [Myxococcota bacterium]
MGKGIGVAGMGADTPRWQKIFVEKYDTPFTMRCAPSINTMKNFDA